jgi:hypothetical protein
MKLTAAFSLLQDLRIAIQTASLPTIYALINSPSLLFNPIAVSRLFMANIWVQFGRFVDEAGRAVKEDLIPPNAHGVVLDIGAGNSRSIRLYWCF